MNLYPYLEVFKEEHVFASHFGGIFSEVSWKNLTFFFPPFFLSNKIIFFLGVREDYLNKEKSGTSILPKMRTVLVDWLIQVHSQFNLLQETLYLTVAILDRFLQVRVLFISRTLNSLIKEQV